jgi:rSAM/selenodomain-associated transferase 2
MVSIIIPTYNEEDNIHKLVGYLNKNAHGEAVEIIVADGASQDSTTTLAKEAGAIVIDCIKKGRAAQMNYGASFANGDVLYFVHADTFPAASFVKDIKDALADGYGLGRYRTKFDSNKFILKMNAFFTRFDLFMCYGGDQTLFIKKDVFNTIGGFKEDMLIMEDYEIIERAKQQSPYKIFSKATQVSARKYETNNWLKVQKANYIIVQMYKNGASQNDMVTCYKKMLKLR